MIDEELIMAYADGELDPVRRAEVEAAIAADPTLAERVARHRRLADWARERFDGVLSEPVPPRLLDVVVRTEAAAPAARRSGRGVEPFAAWAGIAAALIIGVGLGVLLPRQSALLAPVAGEGLRAVGPLAAALDDQLAAQAAGPVRIGLTFRDGTGAYCRTFAVQAEALAGLACRRGGVWRVRATAAMEASAPEGAYRTAASAAPAPILAAVDALAAGEALDAETERKARDTQWSR